MKRKIALASWIASIVLAIISMIMPPMGVIDGSVLILIAQLLILCATFLGVESYISIIKPHGK